MTTSHRLVNTPILYSTEDDILGLPAPPGGPGGIGNASFAWLEGSRYWNDFDLPDGPSLRLAEDDFFFQLVRGNKKDKKREDKQQLRFFHALPKRPDIRALEMEELEQEELRPKKTPVPLKVRKMEIELAQRKLPRYPSQTHRNKACFYPLQQNTSPMNLEAKFLAFYRSRLQARTNRIADNEEKRRQRKEEKEKRRAAREAKRKRLRDVQPKKRDRRKQAGQVGAVPRSLAFSSVDDTNDSTGSIADVTVKEGHGPMDTSRTTRDQNASDYSMMSSIGTLSDDEEFYEEEIDDEEYYAAEMEHFYAEDRRKMQQVHSQNIDLIEWEQSERRIEAEQLARKLAEVEARLAEDELKTKQKAETESSEELARRILHNTQGLAQKLENYRVRMAVYLVVKWAEEDAQKLAQQEGLASHEVQLTWDKDRQYRFLHDFYLNRGRIKKQLFGSDIEDNDGEMEFTDLVESMLSPRKENSFSSLPSLQKSQASISSFASIRPDEVPEEKYEPQIGVIPPKLQALIIQAKADMRTRKVPEEHKKKFKPSCIEASEVGRFTRLNEYVIEGYGTRVKEEKPLLPSAVWQQGQEQVSLPKIQNTRPQTFLIFNEAAALGQLKALKPKVTTNYNPLSSSNHQKEDIDIDDENRHKVIRTNYLTDMYVHDHRENKKEDMWDVSNLEEETQYENLDDVKLPTEACPVHKPVTRKMSQREMQDAIAQAVAERAWERRYRLERPHAEQKIKSGCSCKFCKHASPFQTHAYRKKWLVQQGLWNEPATEEQEGKAKKHTIDHGHDESHANNLSSDMEQTELQDTNFPGEKDTIPEGFQTQNDFYNMDEKHLSEPDVSVEESTYILKEVDHLSSNSYDEQDVFYTAVPDNQGVPNPFENTDNYDVENQDNNYQDNLVENSSNSDLNEESIHRDVLSEAHDLATKDAELNVDDCMDKAVGGNGSGTVEDKDAAVPEKSTDLKPSHTAIQPRRKRSFLYEVKSLLGISQHDDNDKSASAKAQRLRQEKRRNRKTKQK